MSEARRHRFAGAFGFAPGLALAALAVAAAWWALAAIGERLMLRGAEQIAQGHVQSVRESIPGFDALLDGAAIDATSLAQLQRAQRWGEVQGLALYGRDGIRRAGPILDAPLPAVALAGGLPVSLGHVHTDAGGRRTVHAFVPVAREGRVIGVAGVEIDHSARFARMREALAQATAVVGALLAALGTLYARLHARSRVARAGDARRLRWLAEHDALSGAANRAHLRDALSRVDAAAPGSALLVIDLHRFGEVNDIHGHAAGDEVLRQAAERLRSLLRQQDLLARLGSDEFAVLQSAVGAADAAAGLAQRVVEALAQPFAVQGRAAQVGACVGVALTGAGSASAADLQHQAEMALSRAKARGRGRVEFYDAALDREIDERRALAAELRAATAAGVLEMHYQPLYAADGASLLGYEALMRWPHAVRGMVPPNVFIPLAEATGQIEALGAFALERACAEAARWPGALSVAVNLSAAQFRDGQALVALVQQCLLASGLSPARLTLEITESLLMSDAESAVRTLHALARLRVQIAMDDFGIGYSSLGTLWRFPFDKVKIDRAFVKDLERDERVALVIRSIVALAHSLALRVTAEGVETAAQAAMLRQLGCDELQGFLLGRPQAAAALKHLGAVQAHPAQPAAPNFDDLSTQPAAL